MARVGERIGAWYDKRADGVIWGGVFLTVGAFVVIALPWIVMAYIARWLDKGW